MTRKIELHTPSRVETIELSDGLYRKMAHAAVYGGFTNIGPWLHWAIRDTLNRYQDGPGESFGTVQTTITETENPTGEVRVDSPRVDEIV